MFNRFLNHLEEWLIAFLMGAATLVIFVSVTHRYLATVPFLQDALLRINLSWAQELAIYMFIWMAKFGAAYGVRHGTHVGVDVLVRKLPPDKAKWLILFGMAGGAIFTGVVGTLGAKFVWEDGLQYSFHHLFGGDVSDMSEGPTSQEMEIPTWIVHLCIPLGSYLMCFRFLQVGWHFWRTGEAPHHEQGRVEGIEESDDGQLAAEGAQK